MKMRLLVMVLVVLAAMVGPVSAMLHEVTVTAGQLSGIGNDSSTPFDQYSWGFAAYDMGADTNLDMLLDIGSVMNITAIQIQNRLDSSTNTSIALCEIYVADEAAPGFDPTDISNYTTKVFGSGSPSPITGDAAAIRTADITNTAARYFQIHVTDTWAGAPSPAQFADVRVVEVPEPLTMALLSFGGLLALKRRKA